MTLDSGLESGLESELGMESWLLGSRSELDLDFESETARVFLGAHLLLVAAPNNPRTAGGFGMFWNDDSCEALNCVPIRCCGLHCQASSHDETFSFVIPFHVLKRGHSLFVGITVVRQVFLLDEK